MNRCKSFLCWSFVRESLLLHCFSCSSCCSVLSLHCSLVRPILGGVQRPQKIDLPQQSDHFRPQLDLQLGDCLSQRLKLWCHLKLDNCCWLRWEHEVRHLRKDVETARIVSKMTEFQYLGEIKLPGSGLQTSDLNFFDLRYLGDFLDLRPRPGPRNSEIIKQWFCVWR